MGGIAMSKYTVRLGAPIALVAVALLGACRSDQKKGPDSTAPGADRTLNRDLALANRDTVSQPQLKDVPANAAVTPAATRPATRPPVRRPPARSTAQGSQPANPAPPVKATTSSGNVVTTNPAGTSNPAAAGRGAVGMIP